MLSPSEQQFLTPYLTALQNRRDGLTLEEKTRAFVELRWIDSLDEMSDATRALIRLDSDLINEFDSEFVKHYARWQALL